MCDCTKETVINEDRQKCLPVARDILDICVEDIQCTKTFSDALCIDGLCRCQNQYHFESEIRQCYFNKSKYSLSRTSLFPLLYRYIYIYILDRWRCFTELGETCANTYECYQNEENENVTRKVLTCMENVCVCIEDYVRQDNKCVNEGKWKQIYLFYLFYIFIMFIF